MKHDIQRAAVYTLTALTVTALVSACVTLWRRPEGNP